MLNTEAIRNEIYALLTRHYDRVMSGATSGTDDQITLVLDDSEDDNNIREVTVRLQVAIVNVNVEEA